VSEVDYRAISRGAALVRDVELIEGDVILVPERRLFE
jgi:polysaccharide export outer membrane protein